VLSSIFLFRTTIGHIGRRILLPQLVTPLRFNSTSPLPAMPNHASTFAAMKYYPLICPTIRPRLGFPLKHPIQPLRLLLVPLHINTGPTVPLAALWRRHITAVARSPAQVYANSPYISGLSEIYISENYLCSELPYRPYYNGPTSFPKARFTSKPIFHTEALSPSCAARCTRGVHCLTGMPFSLSPTDHKS
jgi:hypothetical protein